MAYLSDFLQYFANDGAQGAIGLLAAIGSILAAIAATLSIILTRRIANSQRRLEKYLREEPIHDRMFSYYNQRISETRGKYQDTYMRLLERVSEDKEECKRNIDKELNKQF